jgi:hypothetical protein
MSKCTYPSLLGLLAAVSLSSAPILAAEPDHAGIRCQRQALDFGSPQAGWTHIPISKFKRDTVYSTEQDGNSKVLRAKADRSASIYASTLGIPMSDYSTLNWRWKTDALIPGADNRNKKREDAPLRIVVSFDGDMASLPAAEKRRFKLAKTFSSAPLPYATLMYIWSEQVPLETIIPSAHTSQVKMLVVASGKSGLGKWQTLQRRLPEDYRRAFGAAPGKLLGISVMSDTDNTGKTALGWYADIVIECAQP